jgi:uncharacterized SAM-binding protein YcdF (DUF218 family)
LNAASLPRGAGRALAVLGALFLFLALLFLLRAPLLRAVGGFLVVSDPAERADLIYLLNGDSRTTVRARHAARRFEEGVAPRIVVARTEDPPATELGVYPNETDVNVAILRELGVPDGAILVLRTADGVASTQDEADALRDFLTRHPAERVVVVTSDYHTRRSRWILRRRLDDLSVDLRMDPAPGPAFDARGWWRSESGAIVAFQEYLKMVHNRAFR